MMWRDIGRTGAELKFLKATRSPLARRREGLGTVTVTMNQRGHGNKRETLFCVYSVSCCFFTELERTKVFLIYTQLCMDPIMTTKGEIQY